MEDIFVKTLGTCIAFVIVFTVWWIIKQMVNKINRYLQKKEKKGNAFVSEEDLYNRMYNSDDRCKKTREE